MLRLHSGGLRRYSPGQLILLKQRPHLADRAVIFFSFSVFFLWRPGSCGAREALAKGEEARNLGCRAHRWAGIPELNFWKAHYSGSGRKWHWGVEGVSRGSRQSVHQSCCGAFRHITAGTNGDQGLERDHMTHKSQNQPFSIVQMAPLSHSGKTAMLWTCFCFSRWNYRFKQWKNEVFIIHHVMMRTRADEIKDNRWSCPRNRIVRLKLKHERMHFIPFNLTESSLSAAEYITVPAYRTCNWHLTNLHSRASKGNKIMRKLQGKWVLVPHGELKLIICDNLSASENSNTSTKLCEPQKGAGKKREEW